VFRPALPRPPASRYQPPSISPASPAVRLTVVSARDLDVRRVVFSLPPGHVNALRDLSTYTPTRPSSSLSFSRLLFHPQPFSLSLKLPPTKSPAPLEGFHGRRLKSGSPRAFATAPSRPLPGPALVNLRRPHPRSSKPPRKFFLRQTEFYFCSASSRLESCSLLRICNLPTRDHPLHRSCHR